MKLRVASYGLRVERDDEKLKTRNTFLLVKYFSAIVCENLRPI
jgi:hypothetical protein